MKPDWKPIKVKLGQIKVWDKNPRMSTKAQAQRIIASERKFGQPVPFLVSPDFLLYDGHQRLAAWFTVYGADYEMDAMQSDRPLSEDEHKELVVTLHTGATGSWNWDSLSSWSAGDLQEWGMNGDALKGWNNDANNLKELLNADNAEPVDAESQIDRAAELAEKWQTKSGQLWKLGDHRLLIGDCTVRENVERLMGGARAGMVFTDPPYGGDVGSGETSFPNDKEKKERATKLIDSVKELFDFSPTEFLSLISDFCEPKISYYFFTNKVLIPEYLNFATKTNRLFDLLLWHKSCLPMGGNKYFPDTEYLIKVKDKGALFNSGLGESGVSYATYWITSKDEIIGHPTIKPIKILNDCVSISSKKDAIVLDLFAGSGTTIIAAHNLNRRCYAMEISEKYGAVILERFFTATGITPELVE